MIRNMKKHRKKKLRERVLISLLRLTDSLNLFLLS